METDHLELHNLRSQAASPSGNARQATPTPDHSLLAAPRPTSNATSSADNSSSQLSVPKPRNSKAPLSTRLWRWWPELAGATSSVFFLIAIIVFLAVIDGSKMDDWHFAWEIKPPTIISILVTVCRINLAFFIAEGLGQLKWVFFEQREHQLADFEQFDEATRGPWGATCFIWNVNRRALVATCGAVLAIMVLAMDPFSQQVLYYASETSEVENAVAKMPSARFYDSGALYTAFTENGNAESLDLDTGSFSGSASSSSDGSFGTFGRPETSGIALSKREASDLETIGALTERDDSTSISSQGKSNCSDTLMARAAYAGLFTSIIPLDFSCPSGSNCTWPAFTTLGVCSECNNITSRLNVTCNTSDRWDMCWYQLIGPGDLPGNSTYPGPNALPSTFGEFASSTQFQSKCSEKGVTKWPLWFTWASRVWDQSQDLLSFTSYRFPKGDDAGVSHCKLPVAHVEQCKLFWCAKTFDSAAVVNGRLNEGPSANVRLVPFDTANATCPGLRDAKPPESKSGAPMQGLIREDRACPTSSNDLGPSDIFWVNKNDHKMTVNMLNPLIHQKAMSVDGSGSTYDTARAAAAVGAGSDAITTAFWDNHEGNLSLTLADVTTAMTNRIRLTDGYENLDGTSTSVHTVIKVTWYWLIYMVAMVLFSLVFFVTAMVFSSERSKAVWKSSSLAVLMHGLEGFDGTELDHRSLSEMGRQAETLWAQLKEDDEGNLRLVQHRL